MYLIPYIFTLGVILSNAEAAMKIDYYRLYDDLFTSYNSDIRPVDDDSEVMEIEMTFALISINEIQEKDQALVTFGYIGIQWNDNFLSWNSSKYHNLYELLVPQRSVWKPDIVIGNPIAQRTQFGFNEMPIRLSASGLINWYPSMLFMTSCDMNIRYYPFDTQFCTIILETVMSRSSELKFVLPEQNVNLQEFGENGQWELVSTSMNKGNEGGYKSVINVNLILKRRRSFYVLNIILPVIFLSCLGSLVFVLPAEAGEKMSLAITTMLAYVVYLTLISDSMPQTSLQTSLLAVYLTVLVALSALSVILSTLVIRLYNKESTNPVPRIGVLLVKYLCHCRKPRKSIIHVQVTPSNTDATTTDRVCDVGNADNVTWQDVSKSLDVFFFWVFMSIFVISSVVCFMLMFI